MVLFEFIYISAVSHGRATFCPEILTPLKTNKVHQNPVI
jgi:hypothetical protein